MDPEKLAVLSNAAIPESVRAAIAQSLISSEATKADYALKAEQLALDRKKFLWSTPFVAALAGLITLTATFVFERVAGRDNMQITMTLEQMRKDMRDSEARLKQQLETASAEGAATVQARAEERRFQYDIVKSELGNSSKTNAERAAVLLFLAKAGVLSSLNRDELEQMAEAQLNSPDKDIIPQLTISPGIVGTDDSLAIAALPDKSAARRLGQSVGLLKIQQDGRPSICTGFLVEPDKVATAGHCVLNAQTADFVLTTTENSVVSQQSYPIDLTRTREFKVAEKTSYVFLQLLRPADPRFTPLTPSYSPPKEGQRLGAIYFRGGVPAALSVWDNDDCKVVGSPTEDIFDHGCDTGSGSSGAPIFDAASERVIGVHFGRGAVGGHAYLLQSPN